MLSVIVKLGNKRSGAGVQCSACCFVTTNVSLRVSYNAPLLFLSPVKEPLLSIVLTMENRLTNKDGQTDGTQPIDSKVAL